MEKITKRELLELLAKENRNNFCAVITVGSVLVDMSDGDGITYIYMGEGKFERV